jgi:dTMP kinase
MAQLRRVIRPALAEGAILLCDRYLPSSLAFQGQDCAPHDGWIRQLNRWNAGIPIPDLTIVFTISPETAAKRIAARGGKQDRFDASAIGEIAQRCAIYARIEEYGEIGPVARIDAEASPDEVQSQVRVLLDPLIFGKGDQDGISM